jgi:predicted metalloprotease
MNRFFSPRGRIAVAATLAGLLTLGVGSSPLAQSYSAADGPATVTLTARDVEASNQKAGAAFSALVIMWTGEFKRLGVPFAAPQLVRYRGGVRTSCGVMAPSNASYCWNSNTIYFDDVFVATQAKLAGRALGTDGDMTAIGIIAHEMGHAVAMQLGYRSRRSYDNEAAADCLAGAFARQAQNDGSLEDGDIDEAFFGMAAAGDPTPEFTGDRRTDARMARLVARNSHGTREQRVQNFKNGLEGGGASCLAELR